MFDQQTSVRLFLQSKIFLPFKSYFPLFHFKCAWAK